MMLFEANVDFGLNYASIGLKIKLNSEPHYDQAYN